jgi:hypothetical protein
LAARGTFGERPSCFGLLLIKQAQWETATIVTIAMTGGAAMIVMIVMTGGAEMTEMIVMTGGAEMTEMIVMIAMIVDTVMTVMTAEAEPWMRKCSRCCRSKRQSAF